MAEVSLRTRAMEVLVAGDPLVLITHTPDGRACPWRVEVDIPKGLGVPAYHGKLTGLFDEDQAAIPAALELAGQLHEARMLLRQANRKIDEAATGLKAAEHAQDQDQAEVPDGG